MSSVTFDTPREHRSLRDKLPGSRQRELTDRAMTWVTFLAVLLALIPLGLILSVTIAKGASAMNWEFLTSTFNFSRRTPGGGYFHGLVGTLYMGLLATVMAVPTGIAAASFLAEYPEHRLVRPVRFFSDVMLGVPSVFVGLFVYSWLVRQWNFGTFTGAISLAIVMLPIVVRTSEEIIRLVPSELRQAAYGLGARRWQVVTKVVLPAAGPGLITGSFLAIARALGETAPLVLTVLAAQVVTLDFQGQGQTALPLLIFREARGAFPAGQARAWAGALELMVLIVLLVVVARLIGRRSKVGGPR